MFLNTFELISAAIRWLNLIANRLSLLILLVSISPICSGKQLKLLTYDPINVDGAGNTASTVMRLKNLDKQSPASCTLHTTDFRSANTGKEMGVVATFYDRDTPGPPPAAGRAVGPAVKVQASPDEQFTIKVDFAHMTEAGESTGELYCDDESIGMLVALKQLGLPMKITVNESPPEKPELALVRDQILYVQLKNDDPVTYPLSWELLIKGRAQQGTGTIGPNDVATLAITPDPEWFSPYQSLFKDEAADGKLTLRYRPKGGQTADSFPAKSIPIKARLNYFPMGRRDLQAAGVIFLCLILGGALSIYFNIDLVNRLRKVGVKMRLRKLAKQTGEIAPQLTSRLRVALLLEPKRITDELPKGFLIIPEAASVLAQCATDVDGLEARVNLAVQVSDAAMREDTAINAGRIAPSLLDRVDRDLAGAQDLLVKSTLSSAELQKAQSWIADASNILDNLDNPDPELENILASRLQDLQAKFTEAVKADPICGLIMKQVPVPFLLLSSGVGGGPQVDRDANSRKLQIVYDLIQMKCTPAQEMIQSLRRQDLRSLQNAELLLREAKDEVTEADIRSAIGADPPQFRMIKDRDVVRVNRASMMKVVFNDPRYNTAAAKRLVECKWDFGHMNLTEQGWEIYHYFPEAKTYAVKVTFRDKNQAEIPQKGTVQLEVSVHRPYFEGRPHSMIEFQRWLIGFLVAVLGLFAGAKDKIVTLDTVGAMFAVFLLGFSIDMAKNLLIPKQS
jgi:hypothetical protein